jgi:hypothetical protein
VRVAGDVAFCLTCEARGYLDGYAADADGVNQRHREL